MSATLSDGGTLIDFALSRDGIAIGSLSAGTTLIVDTRHTNYRLRIADPADREISIQGGPLFPEWTKVRLAGSTAGGSAVKLGWIGIGLRMEMTIDRRKIVTSPVQSIAIDTSPVPLVSAPVA